MLKDTRRLLELGMGDSTNKVTTTESKQIMQLQKDLELLGYLDTGGYYGYYGEKTEKAVNQYKEDHNLNNTGMNAGRVGETTLNSIQNEVDKKSSTINSEEDAKKKYGYSSSYTLNTATDIKQNNGGTDKSTGKSQGTIKLTSTEMEAGVTLTKVPINGDTSNIKTVKRYQEGNHIYYNDNGTIYKDGISIMHKVDSNAYKYVPTTIGGTRNDNKGEIQIFHEMEQQSAHEAQKQGIVSFTIQGTNTSLPSQGFTQGDIQYNVVGEAIFKNGKLVETSDYKYIPDAVKQAAMQNQSIPELLAPKVPKIDENVLIKANGTTVDLNEGDQYFLEHYFSHKEADTQKQEIVDDFSAKLMVVLKEKGEVTTEDLVNMGMSVWGAWSKTSDINKAYDIAQSQIKIPITQLQQADQNKTERMFTAAEILSTGLSGSGGGSTSPSLVEAYSARYGKKVGQLIAKHGDDVVKYIEEYGDDATNLINKYGDDAEKAIKNGISPENVKKLEASGINIENYNGLKIVDEKSATEYIKRTSKSDFWNELASSGVKYNSDDVVAVTKTSDGKLVWLENGNDSAGLNHVIKEHGTDFANKGISQTDIPNYITQALNEGKIIGYQGRGTGRPIYEFTYNGKTERVAITVGSNGFIVGANPVSIK